jgi:hypothetical protein
MDAQGTAVNLGDSSRDGARGSTNEFPLAAPLAGSQCLIALRQSHFRRHQAEPQRR